MTIRDALTCATLGFTVFAFVSGALLISSWVVVKVARLMGWL